MRGIWIVLRAETYRMTRNRTLWVAWTALASLSFFVAVLAGSEMVGDPLWPRA